MATITLFLVGGCHAIVADIMNFFARLKTNAQPLILFICKHKVEILLFVLALVARIAILAVNLHANNWNLMSVIVDDDGYYNISYNLLVGHGFSSHITSPYILNPLRTPGYILFVAGLLWISGNSSWFVIGAQIVVGAMIPLLGWALAQKISGSKRVGIMVGLLLAVEPYFLWQSTIYSTETLFIFLFLIFLLLFSKYLERLGGVQLLWSSFLLGVLILIKPTVQYLPFICAGFIIVLTYRKNLQRGLLHAFFFLLICGAVLAPWLWRNYQIYNSVGISAIPAFNSWLYLAPSVIALDMGQNFDALFRTFSTPSEQNADVITLSNSHEYMQRTLAIIVQHPRGLILSVGLATATFFTGDGMLTVLGKAGYILNFHLAKPALVLLMTDPVGLMELIVHFALSPFILIPLLRLVWIAATIGCGIGLVLYMRKNWRNPTAWFFLMTIAYFVVTTMIDGLGANRRFRMPVDPLILTFALIGFGLVKTHFRKRLSPTV